MKALLDAHLSSAIAEHLRAEGLDVDAITARDNISNDATDAEVMHIAHAEQRAVVTNNIRDFRPIAAQRIAAGDGHSGLILVPSSRARTRAAMPALAEDVARIMRDNPGGLANFERWV